jgi:hypothetical protein
MTKAAASYLPRLNERSSSFMTLFPSVFSRMVHHSTAPALGVEVFCDHRRYSYSFRLQKMSHQAS